MGDRAPPPGARSRAAGAPDDGGDEVDVSLLPARGASESEPDCGDEVDVSLLPADSPSSMSLASESEPDGGGDEVDVSLLPDDGAREVTQGSEGAISLLPDGGGPSSGAWVPGGNTGRYIGPGAALGPQAEVLAVNVYLTLKRLPKALQSLECALPPAPGLEGGRHVERSARVAGRLLAMRPATVKNVYYRVRQNGWQPVAEQQGAAQTNRRAPTDLPQQGVAGALAQPRQRGEAHARLLNTVRVALAHAHAGGSYVEFPSRLWMHYLTGGDVSVSAVNREFFKAVVAFGSLSVSHLDADDFNGELPGLGIPSDFSILADPVALGVGPRSRHDTLCVICLCLASKWTCRLYTPMHSAPAMSIGAHAGDAMAALLLRSMAQHPAQWGERVLGF